MADGSASAFGRAFAPDSAASETRDRVAAMNGSPHIAVCPPAPSHMQDKFGLPEKPEDGFSSSGAAPTNRPNYLESVSNSEPSIPNAQARDSATDKVSHLDTAPSAASPLSGRPGLPDKPSKGPFDRSVSPASSLGRTGTGTGTGTGSGSKVESSKEEARSPAISHDTAGPPSSQGALGLPEKPPVSSTSDGPGPSGYSPKSMGADSKTTSETAAPDGQDRGPSILDGPPFLAICPPAPPGYRGMGMSNSDSGPDNNMASGGDGPAADASKSAEGLDRSESSPAGLDRAPAMGGPPRVAICPPAPPGHEAKYNDSFGSGPASDGTGSNSRVEKSSEGGVGSKSPIKEGASVGGAAASGVREGMNSAPSRASPFEVGAFGEPALPSPAASVSKSDVASESAGDRNVGSAHNGEGKTEASSAPATHTGPAVQSVPAPAPAPNMSPAGGMANSEAGRGEGSTGDAGSGQKRKIEEYAAPANVTTPLTADQAEPQITPPEKKAKVDEAVVGTDEGSPASKATKAKRKKKAPPVVGRSTRKTRSQGPAEL